MVDSAIRVAVRSRPLLKNEEAPSLDALSFRDSNTVHLQNRSFTFDHVFQPGVSNEAVYNIAVAEKIRYVFEGYNVTILAYGPTGSGKTYTMGTDYSPKTSNNSDIGIIPRGLKEIFRVLESQQETIDFSVKVSFLELYREEIYDLLQKSANPCNLREDADGVKVINLTEVPVKSIEDAFVTLGKGSNVRHTSATAKNLKSSRSHAIFSVYVEQTDKINFNFKRAKFQLVDLAGSERMGSSKTAGLQVKEGININLGLLSLGKVITHLIDDKQHIPYRDSKLTRLLQDSLGGNSHTVMIACVNPSSTSVEETLSTLRYASNTRSIKNRPVVNVDPPAVQIEKLKKQVEALQAAMYKVRRISCSESIVPSISTNGKVESDIKELHRQLQTSYVQISSLNHKIIEVEEKNTELIEKLKSLYNEIKLIVAELTTAATINPDLDNHLKKLEEIRDHCLQLLAYEDVASSLLRFHDSSQSSEVQQNFEGSCESVDSIQDIDIDQQSSDSMTEQQSLEAMTEKQKASSQLLENVQRTLNIKEDMARNIQDFFKTYETTVNEDYVSSLVSKIQALVKEKTNLEESMKSAVAKEKNELEQSLKKAHKQIQKENQDQIQKYEQEIKNLQSELRSKKMVLQLKEENKAKIVILQKEIQDLKKYKVQLVKQMKDDSNKFARLQRQKEKEVAKLVKEGRKKEFEFMKMKSKFERQMHVLKHKVDQATCSKKKLLQAIQRKKPGQTGAKSRQSFSREGLEDWIEEELKVIVCNGLAKVHCEVAEKEATSLTQQIQSIEKFSKESPTEDDPQQADADQLKAMLQVLLDKIEDMRKHGKEDDESGKQCIIVDGINSMSQAKVGLEYLFKKCVSVEVESAKQQQILTEDLKKEQSLKEISDEKITSLTNENKSLKEQITASKVEQEEKIALLKWEHDSKILHLIAEMQSATRSSLTSDTDPNIAERVQMQEQEIERLLTLRANYENKCKEVNQLQEELFKAKKGKRTKWLCDLTNYPNQSSSSMEENKSTSMIEEYLSDPAEESFYNDQNDPDWRLTPLHKQMQKERLLRRGTYKIQKRRANSGAGESSDSASPVKKSAHSCQCHGQCKTMRCHCKKRRVMCSDLCVCDKAHCENVVSDDRVNRKLSLET